MKTKQQRTLFFKLTVVAVSFLILAGCAHQESNFETTRSPLLINYSFTAEATYDKIEIDQSRLIYTYFDDVENRCAQWIAQEPCWTKKDLKTREADLTDKEISDLITLIHQTGFMQLENIYGGASELQRFYPYYLKVQLGDDTKEVVYQSYPSSTPAPEAFQILADKLHEIVAEKFRKQ